MSFRIYFNKYANICVSISIISHKWEVGTASQFVEDKVSFILQNDQ